MLRAARQGREHRNPEIADAADSWAQDVVRPRRLRRDAGVAGLLSLVADAAGGGWFGMAIAERRAAKRILAARGAPPGRHL